MKPDGHNAEDEVFTSATAEVFYVDFGNTERVSVADVRPLEAQFTQLPGQVLRCSLANTQPFLEPGESWLKVAKRLCVHMQSPSSVRKGNRYFSSLLR